MPLNAQQVKDLNTNLKNLTDILGRFDKQLKTTIDQVATFDKAFGSQKNFEDFHKSLSQFGDKQARNFKIISDGLSELSKNIRAIPNNTDTILDRIGGSLVDLKKGLNEFRNINSDRLKEFFNTITDVFIKLGQVRPISTDIRLSLSSLSSIVNALQKLQGFKAEDVKKVHDFLFDQGGLLDTIEETFKRLKSIGSLNPSNVEEIGQRTTTSLNAISEIVRAFLRLSLNREDLQINDINVTAFDRIFQLVSHLTEEISKAARNIRAEPSEINAVKKAVDLVVTLFLPDKDGGSVFERLVFAIKNLPNLETKKLIFFTDKFGQLAPAFQVIGRIFKELGNSALGFEATNVKGLAELVKAFSEFISGGTVQNLAIISKNIERRDIGGIAGRIKRSLFGFRDFRAVFQLMREILGQLAKAGGKLTENVDVGGFAKLLESFTAFVKFIPEMDKISQSLVKTKEFNIGRFTIEVKRILDLSPVFSLLQIVAKRISKVAKGLSKSDGLNPTDLDNLNGLITSFSRFARAIPTLIKATTQVPQLRGRVLLNKLRPLARLDPLFGILKRFAKSAANIASEVRDAGDLGALSKIISAISKFADALPKILRLAKNLEGGVIIKPRNLIARIRQYLEISKIFVPLKTIINKLEEASRGIKEPDKIEFLVKALKEVFGLFEDIQNLGGKTAKFPDLKGFESFVDQVAKGLSRLENVKASKQALSATAESLRAFDTLSNLDSAASRTGSVGLSQIFQQRIIENFADSVVGSVKRMLTSIKDFRSNSIAALRDVGETFRNSGNEIRDVGERLLSSFSVSNVLDSEAFDIASNFDELSSQMRVFAKDIPLEEAQAFADQIGIDYPLSANEALAATLDLAKAGQDFRSIQSILPSAADLAALSESKSIERTTSFLIAAEGSFAQFADGVEASFENIGVASDIAFQAANASTASVDSITDALVKAGPAARQYGLTLEETAAVITQFEDAGIRGAEAGRLVRTVLQGFSQDKAKDELERLGIAFQNVDGTLRPLPDVIEDVSNALADVTPVERARSLRQFGDVFAQTGTSILVTNGGIKETVEAFKEQGEAQAAAQELMKSFQGQVEQLRGSFETLLKNAALPLLDNFITPLIGKTTQVVNFFLSLPPSVIETASTFVFLGSVTATLTGALLIAVGALTTLSGLFIVANANALKLAFVGMPRLILGATLFGTSLIASLAIISTFAIALGGLSFVIVNFFKAIQIEGSIQQKAFQNLKDSATEAFGEIVRIVRTVVSVLRTLFGEFTGGDEGDILFGGITQGLTSLTDKLRAFTEAAKEFDTERIIKAVASLSRIIEPLIKGFITTGVGLFQLLLGDVTALDTVNEGLSNIAFGITAFVEKVTGGDFLNALVFFEAGDLERGVSEFFTAMSVTIQNFIKNNARQVQEISDFLIRLFNPFNKIGSILRLVGLDQFGQIFTDIGNRINEGLSNVVGVFLTAASGGDVTKAITDLFGGAGDTILFFVNEIGQSLTYIGDIFRTFFALLQGNGGGDQAVNKIGTTFERLLEIIASSLNYINQNFLKPLSENLPQILGNISNFIRSLVADFQPFLVVFGFASKSVLLFGETLLKVFSGEASGADLLVSFVEGFVGTLVNIPRAIGQVLRNIGNTLGLDFVDSFLNAISNFDFIGAAGVLIKGLLDLLGDVISKVFGGLGETLSKSGDDFLKSIGDAILAGDALTLIQLIGSRVGLILVKGFELALKLPFLLLVDLFDRFLDQFENRVVGGIVLALGGIVITAISALLVALPGLFNRFIVPALGRTIFSVLSSVLPQFAVSAITAVFSPVQLLLIAAAIATVLGALIFAVFNDLDDGKIRRVIRGRATRIVDTLEESLEDLAARSQVDGIIFGTLLRAVEATRILDVLAENIRELANGIREAITGALSGVLGDTVAGSIANFVANFVEGIAGGVDVLAVLIRGFISNVATVANVVREVFSFIGRAIGTVVNPLINILRSLGEAFLNIAKFVAIAAVAFGVLVVAVRAVRASMAQTTASVAANTTANSANAASSAAAAAGQNGLATAVKGLLRNLLRLGALLVVLQAAAILLEALGAGFRAFEERGPAAGIVEFLKSVAFNLLELFRPLIDLFGGEGATDSIITQWLYNFNQLEFVLTRVAEAIDREMRRVISGLSIQFIELVRRAEQAAADIQRAFGDEVGANQASKSAQEFFTVTDILTGNSGLDASRAGAGADIEGLLNSASVEDQLAGTLSFVEKIKAVGKEIGQEALLEGLANDPNFVANFQLGSTLDTLEVSLTEGEKALLKFKQLSGELQGAVDPTQVVLALNAYADTVLSEFDKIVAEQAGSLSELENIDEVTRILGASQNLASAFRNQALTIDDQFALLESSLRTGGATRQIGGEFIRALFDDPGAEAALADISKEQADQYAQLVLDALASGTLSEEEAQKIVGTFGLAIFEGGVVLADEIEELKAAKTAIQDLYETIEQSNIADLTQQFEDGTIAVDEYIRAINDANNAIADQVTGIAREQLGILAAELGEGNLNANVFAVEASRLLDETIETGRKAIEEAEAGLVQAQVKGLISQEEFDKQTEVLDEQTKTILRFVEVQRQLQPLTIDLQTGKISEAEFADAAKEILDEVEETINANPELDLDIDLSQLEDATDGIVEGGDAVASVVGDVAEALEEVEEAREEFAENTQKINEDFAKKEADILGRIDKNRTDSLKEAQEAERDFQRQQERDREDHQKRLKQIDAEGAEAIQDAVANRDSAAAQNAVRNRDSQVRREEQEFRDKEAREREDFALEQERRALRAEERRRELEQDLINIRQERDQKLAAEREKLAEIENANRAAIDAEKNFNNQRIGLAKEATDTMLEFIKKFSPEATKLIENGAGVIEALIESTGNNLFAFVSNTQANINNTLSQNVTAAVNAIQGLTNNVLSQLGSAQAAAFQQSQQAIIINQSESQSGGAILDSSFSNFGGPRAGGGDVDPFHFFRVQDRADGAPELLTQGNDTFLIPGRRGRVIPPTRAPRASGGFGGINVNVDLSGMNFSGVDGDPSKIAAMVESRVVDGLRGVLNDINSERKGF